MSDLCLGKTDEQDFDLVFKDGDLVLSNSLQMSVILSIASWRRSDNYEGSARLDSSIGGWWADALNDIPLGSRLWTLFKEKLNNVTLENAKKLVKEALQWMIDDGVAKDVSVSAGIGNNRNTAIFEVGIVKPSGNEETFQYEINWEAS